MARSKYHWVTLPGYGATEVPENPEKGSDMTKEKTDSTSSLPSGNGNLAKFFRGGRKSMQIGTGNSVCDGQGWSVPSDVISTDFFVENRSTQKLDVTILPTVHGTLLRFLVMISDPLEKTT